MKRKKKYFILFIFLSLLIRLYFVSESPLTLLGDEVAYYNGAKSFLTEGVLLNSRGMPTAYRPPLYFLFVSTFLYLSNSIFVIKIAQAVLSVIILLLLFQIATKIFGEKIGWTCFLAGIFYMPFIWAPTRLYSEIFFLFFFVAGFFYFVKLWQKLSLLDSIKWALLEGLASLVRGTALLLFPLFVIALFYRHYQRFPIRSDQRHLIKIFLVILVTFSATLLPWVIRNYYVFGFPKYSTELGMVLYISYFPHKGKVFSKIPREDPIIQEMAMIPSEIESERFLLKKTFDKLKQSPRKIFELIPLKFVSFWSPFHWEVYHTLVYDWSYVFLFPFFLYGFIRLRLNDQAFIPLGIPLVSTLTMGIIFYGSARMRFPLEPFFVIIASFGLYEVLQRVSKVGKLGIVCWLVINLFASLNLIYLKSMAKNLAVLLGLW